MKSYIMQNNGLYRVKKYPPHSKRGGYFFVFGKKLNLMTLVERPVLFLCCGALESREAVQHADAVQVLLFEPVVSVFG